MSYEEFIDSMDIRFSHSRQMWYVNGSVKSWVNGSVFGYVGKGVYGDVGRFMYGEVVPDGLPLPDTTGDTFPPTKRRVEDEGYGILPIAIGAASGLIVGILLGAYT